MKRTRRIGLLAASFAVACGQAQPLPDTSLKPLSFLSGRWVSEKGPEIQEESWSPVSGDSMLGSFRIVQGGKPVFYEFWVVEVEDHQPVLKMKHFNANLAGWEDKNASTRMPLASSTKEDATFAATDGSVSLHYHRSGDLLTCIVHHAEKGKPPNNETFALKRASGL